MAEASSTAFPLAGKRVWIAGHRGMVGSALTRRLRSENCTLIKVARNEVDLREQAAVRAWMTRERPEVADHPEVHAALAGLAELDREVVLLWAWEGLAPREIAVVTGLSANAVSIRLHKAKKRLAESLGKNDAATGQIPGTERRPR